MLLSIFTLPVCQSTYQHIFSDTYVQKFSLQCFMSTSYGGLTINFSTCFFWYIYVFFFRTTLCIVCQQGGKRVGRIGKPRRAKHRHHRYWYPFSLVIVWTEKGARINLGLRTTTMTIIMTTSRKNRRGLQVKTTNPKMKA